MKKSVSFVPFGRPTRFVRTRLSQVVPVRAAPTMMKLGKRIGIAPRTDHLRSPGRETPVNRPDSRTRRQNARSSMFTNADACIGERFPIGVIFFGASERQGWVSNE